MFDDDEDEGMYEGHLREDMERFQAFAENGEPFGFLDSDRWEALLDQYIMQGMYGLAVQCANEALSQFSYNNLFKIRKAQALSAMGKLKEAINLLTEVEKSGLTSFELFLTKAAVFSQLKDSKNAIKYFTASLNVAPPEDKDEVYLDLAMEYENKTDYKSALKILKEAAKYNPKNEGAIYEMAFCYDQLGMFDKSIQCYLDFIDDNPYSFTAWYNLGNAYLRIDNYDKAIWAYEYCILINDDFGPVFYNLGHAYLSKDEYRKAIENFGKCIELDGDDPVAFCYMGECYEQLGELEKAKELYRKSLELSPMLPDAWLGLGIVEDLEGRTKEGITLIQKASELDPDNAGIYHVLAGAYEKLEELDLAKEYYELALTFDPTDEECLINYINLLKEEGYDIAMKYLDRFEELDPDSSILALLRVDLYWLMGESKLALDLYKKCLEGDRDYAQKLFEINPSLKSVKEFVLLGD